MDALTMVGIVVVAVVSITSHETAHGFVADRLGDSTAREQGRLTLNPIPHIDLFFTLLSPLFLIPGVSLLLLEIIFRFVQLLTIPFGVWTDVEPQLNRILFG